MQVQKVYDAELFYCEKCGGLVSRVQKHYQTVKEETYTIDGYTNPIVELDASQDYTYCNTHFNTHVKCIGASDLVFKLLAARLVGKSEHIVVPCSVAIKTKSKLLTEADLMEVLL